MEYYFILFDPTQFEPVYKNYVTRPGHRHSDDNVIQDEKFRAELI